MSDIIISSWHEVVCRRPTSYDFITHFVRVILTGGSRQSAIVDYCDNEKVILIVVSVYFLVQEKKANEQSPLIKTTKV